MLEALPTMQGKVALFAVVTLGKVCGRGGTIHFVKKASALTAKRRNSMYQLIHGIGVGSVVLNGSRFNFPCGRLGITALT